MDELFEGLEELPLMDQMEVYQRVLRKKREQGIISLPEMAMLTCLDEWLYFARTMLRAYAA